MACEAPILTHRREAERSTRPRTPQTNVKVAQNTVKHALRAPGRYRRGRPGPMAWCAKQSQWPATATRKTRLAGGRSRQTNPICQVQRPGAPKPMVPNKANLPPQRAKPCQPGDDGRRCQTKPICRARRPVSRTDGVKQSPFTGGQIDANRCLDKGLWSRRRSMETRKHSQFPCRMDGGHGRSYAVREGRRCETKPICAGFALGRPRGKRFGPTRGLALRRTGK